MSQESPEDVAREIYRLAGFRCDEPVPAPELARSVLGEGAIRFVPARALPGPACIARSGQRWTIHLRDGLSPRDINFNCAHELAEWFIRSRRLRPGEVEAFANQVAAELVAPRPAFARAAVAVGHDYAALSRIFVVTQSCAALRLGEATGAPLVLVAPTSIRVRGAPYPWPRPLESLRRDAGPALQKTRVSDAQARVVVRPSA